MGVNLVPKTNETIGCPWPVTLSDLAVIMCKVIQFHFLCEHSMRFRKSRCGGTYHKQTRSSTKAACCAEPYIIRKLLVECNKCLQDAWNISWERKIHRAISFRDRLAEKGLPGVEAISGLVRGLQDEHMSAFWDLRQSFPPPDRRPSIERVKYKPTEGGGKWKQPQSPLKLEVHPHDVVLREDGYMEQDTDDDDDCIRSTDPLHPISTIYDHPLDNQDDTWLREHLASEDLDASHAVTEGFDFESTGWGWGWGADEYISGTVQINNSIKWVSIEDPRVNGSPELTAWGPEAQHASSSADLGMNSVISHKDTRKALIEEAISSFWRVVNAEGDDGDVGDDDDDNANDNNGNNTNNNNNNIPATNKHQQHPQHPPSPPHTPPNSPPYLNLPLDPDLTALTLSPPATPTSTSPNNSFSITQGPPKPACRTTTTPPSPTTTTTTPNSTKCAPKSPPTATPTRPASTPNGCR